MSTGSWKLENDLCRCCHSEGTHKNLAEPCLEGQEEIFSGMLQETLDINVRPVAGPLCTATYTICEPCIMRLQDAWSFKQQVLQCEERFHDLYARNVIKIDPENITVEIKREPDNESNEDLKEERLRGDSDDEDYEVPFADDEPKSDIEVEIKEESKKTKPRKLKAKPKAKKKPPARRKADKTSPDAQDETIELQQEKKGDDEEPIDMPYTVGEIDGIKQYICSWCKKSFGKLQNFSQHYRHVHLKLRPKLRACYMCPVKVPGHMRAKHLEEAHGVPRPECLACGKKFAFPFQVIQHQKAFHMNEKAYACPKCDMRFELASKLAKHSIKHSSLRPYRCEYCDKAFRWKKNLTTHVMVHLNDKRHVCFICSEAFVQSTSLKYHVTKKHPELV